MAGTDLSLAAGACRGRVPCNRHPRIEADSGCQLTSLSCSWHCDRSWIQEPGCWSGTAWWKAKSFPARWKASCLFGRRVRGGWSFWAAGRLTVQSVHAGTDGVAFSFCCCASTASRYLDKQAVFVVSCERAGSRRPHIAAVCRDGSPSRSPGARAGMHAVFFFRSWC